MSDALSELLDNLTSIVIFIMCFASIMGVFDLGLSYDAILTEKSANRTSIDYTLAYGDEDLYVTREIAFMEILDSEIETVKINGNVLDAQKRVSLKDYDVTAVNLLKNTLTSNEYKKILTFDKYGVCQEIDYVSR